MFKYADIIKQADPARQRMLAQGRAERAAGTQKPLWEEGDWARTLSKAPLVAQVLNPELYKKEQWDHLPDVAKGVAKGVVAGANVTGQAGLSMLQGAVDNKLWSNPEAREYIGYVKDGLSDVNKEWQQRLGTYNIENKTPGSWTDNFINNPGQQLQRFFTGWVPSVAALAGTSAVSGAIGQAGKWAGQGALKVADALKATRFANVSRGIAGGVRSVKKGIDAYRNMIPNAVARFTPNNLAPAVRTWISRAATKAPSYLASIGSAFPIVDATTGITHVSSDTSAPVGAFKKAIREIAPYFALATPVSAGRAFVLRNPVVQEGALEGATRGVIESAADTATEQGLVGDYGVPALNTVIKKAPSGIRAAYYGLTQGDPAKLVTGIQSPEAQLAAGLFTASQVPSLQDKTRQLMLQDSTDWINKAPYNRLATLTGLQSRATSAVKGISNAVQGKPNYGKAFTRGVQGAVHNRPELKETLYGKNRVQDADAAIAGVKAFKETRAGDNRNIPAAVIDAYNKFHEKAAPETARLAEHMVGRVLEEVPKATDYILDKIPDNVKEGIGRAGEVYDKLTPAQRVLLAQSGKRIAGKIKDKLFTDTTQQQQQ